MKICPKCKTTYEELWSVCPNDGILLQTFNADPMLGKIIGDHYEIISILGKGGMSVVYKARHKLMDRLVALKILHAEADKTAMERFRQEAKAASSLNHPNIISIYDFGIIDGQAFLVMDNLQGQTLNEVLQEEGTLDFARAVRIFRQICQGLEHAHKNGIIHRDLKPSNIHLVKGEDGNELVKILDFGIAKMLHLRPEEQNQLTQTGEIFGSPLYMSPEQCQAKPLDTRSDIYSLGCLMYEALTGRAPIRGDTAYDTMTKHVTEEPPSFKQVCPNLNIDQNLESIVFTCLEKSPEERYQSVAELLADLPAVQPDSGSINVKSVMHPTKQKKELKFLRWGFWTLFVFFAAVFAYGACDYGPDNDKGTVLEKTFWNGSTTLAQTCINYHLWEPAKAILKNAEAIARRDFSNKNRTLTALAMQRDLYIKAHMFEELAQVNNRITTLQKDMLYDGYKTRLKELASMETHKSDVEKNLHKVLAPILFDNILHQAKALAGQNLDKEEENLLLKAHSTYSNLLGSKDPLLADLKILLAECYIRQQQTPKVRPLLQEALDIFNGQDKPNPRQQAIALLKLGQADRDSTRYQSAQAELEKALKISESLMPPDNYLRLQCLNSYASYLAEVGQKEEAEQYFNKALQLDGAKPSQDIP